MEKITIEHKNYPELLKQIKNPPKQLYILGTLKKSENYPLAVVGTRKVSDYGKRATEYFVKVLARAGATIISGLALGIDGLAHKTALGAGAKTIAVLGSGLNNIFPTTHRKLAQDIIDSDGAIISEYPPETPALRAYFPQRNRIVSGLSLGVLVIEAPLKSGALITAEYALKQGRKVFAVPGRIYDANSAGTNYLIQKGAVLVTKPEQILKKLGIKSSEIQKQKITTISPEQQFLIKFLSKEPTHIDNLAKQSKIKTPELIALLTQLEINDMVKDTGDGYYIKT